MKAIKLIVVGMMLILAGSMQGQISVRLNLGTQPAWGPQGYNDVRYYYLPDVEAYYDVHNSMFIYMSGNRWVRRSYLPARYRNYDLYGGYKVVMNDYRGNAPYSHFREHRMKYARGYRGGEQRNIGNRDSRNNYQERTRGNDQRYRNSNRGQVRGNDREQYRSKGNDKKEERGNGRNKKEGRDD